MSEILGPNIPYDGNKILYVAMNYLDAAKIQGANMLVEPTPPKEAGGHEGVSVTIDPHNPKRMLKVEFTPTKPLKFANFPEERDNNGDISRQHLALIDVTMKQKPATLFKQLGDAFYDERREKQWASIKEICRNYQLYQGYKQSVIVTSSGAIIQLDTSYKVVHKPAPLIELFAKKCGKRDVSQLRIEDCRIAAKKLKEEGVTWKLSAKYTKREFKLRSGYKQVGSSIDDVPVTQSMFFDNEKDCERSVYDYFTEKYPQYPLQRPDLPCINLGPQTDPRKMRVPMELLSLADFQPAAITPELQSEMIKVTTEEPVKRFDAVKKIHHDLVSTGSLAADQFGLRIDNRLIEVNAKQLKPTNIYYADGRTGQMAQASVDMKQGSWRLGGGGAEMAFIKPIEISSYAVINFERGSDPRKMIDFLGMLERMAKGRRMSLGNRVGGDRNCGVIDGTNAGRNGESIDRFLEMELKRLPDKPGLLICIMGDKVAQNGAFLYPAIKRWSHTVSGIPTQCVQKVKALENPKTSNNPQYHAGLLLKINLKLGGANVYAPEPGLGLMRTKPTIVFGVDVNHSAPNSQKPSFSALLATMDKECSDYHTIVGAQRMKQEGMASDTFVANIRTCLRKWLDTNGTPPQRIVFYRDGVANNQFHNECAQEIRCIREACSQESNGNYVPELIYIVVQQRTKLVLARSDGNGGVVRVNKGAEANANCGTVVDAEIVSKFEQPHLGNFYMVSQHGMKGTARPHHYHILANDGYVPLDDITRFTFDLCFLYARAIKIVSRPAPVYYAHRAAFLAQYYEANYREAQETWEAGSSASTGSAGSGSSSVPTIQLEKTTAGRVYFA